MTMCVSYVYKRRKLKNSVAILPKKVTKNLHDICSSYISSVDSHCHSTVAVDNEGCKFEMNSFDPADEFSTTGLPVISGKSSISDPPLSHIPVVFTRKLPTGSINLDSVIRSDEFPIRETGSAQKVSEAVDLNFMSELGSSASEECSSPDSHLEQYAVSARSATENVIECCYFDASLKVVSKSPYDSSESPCIKQFAIPTRCETNDVAESSFSDVSLKVVVEPSCDSSATSEPGCNNHQLVEDAYPISLDFSTNCPDGNITQYCLACQICNLIGNSSDMLICDLCEKACHLHCCSEKIPFKEDWYCQICSRNRPRSLLDANSEDLFSTSGQCRRRMLRLELGPILFMLSDTEAYKSKVRIGQSFQAEVPEWPDTRSQFEDPFGEPSKLDMEHVPILRVGGNINSHTIDSIGNWVQCRDKHGCGAICGKWRRAPLFVQQTDDWDCSCALLWDPYHADCSVPQELETEEILKQLKYIEVLRSRYPKQACRQYKS